MSIEDIEPAQDTLPAPQKTSSRPGVLRAEVWLTVHTRQAQLLIHGRKGTRLKPTIVGLLGFAERLRVIWDGARADDPWADWWLIKVCDAIEATRACIVAHMAELDRLLAVPGTGMEVTLVESQRPARTRLQFANPYAYQGAQLLSQYDALACRVLTANRIGLLDNATRNDVLTDCARKLRAIYMIPRSYRFTGVDRSALLAGKGTIRTACWTMGEVPDAVLHGERLPALAPRKSGAPANTATI
ncbi:MAG: TIGR03761 family integrating conjugative element protein [Gammaproteobacteria bacterium]|nr:TIGR03761 family integrating conjugative element protein [Gammaproteobacteria bacterium]